MTREAPDNSLTDFTQAVGLLVRRLRAASAGHELSWTQVAVIGRLAKEGPATTAALARAEGMKPQSMGATVAALEAEGLIARKPHPTDGRQAMLELTPKGAAVRASAKDAKRMWLAQAVSRLTERERNTLFAASDIMRRLVDL
jgi:DNA-binding MarR family transcriptional regulator